MPRIIARSPIRHAREHENGGAPRWARDIRAWCQQPGPAGVRALGSPRSDMSQFPVAIVSLLTLLASAPEATAPRERVEWIELLADGASGRVATTPEFMQGEEAVYLFGRSGCRSLDKRTLDELFAAMRAGTLVDIEPGAKTGDDGPACVEAVRLFAPPRS
jgi:hypothetical protein